MAEKRDHPYHKEPLTWDEPLLDHQAWGYYGNTAYMYGKVYVNDDKWFFKRSYYKNSGYLKPLLMEGITSVEEAMQVAQVYYFIDGHEKVEVR